MPFNGSNKAEIECRLAGDGRELVGTAGLLFRTIAMESQTADLPVPNCECVDHGPRRIRSIAR